MNSFVYYVGACTCAIGTFLLLVALAWGLLEAVWKLYKMVIGFPQLVALVKEYERRQREVMKGVDDV